MKKKASANRSIQSAYRLSWQSESVLDKQTGYITRLVDLDEDLASILCKTIDSHYQDYLTKKSPQHPFQPLDENSQSFYLLVRMLNDCRERGQLLKGFKLSVAAYEYACMSQLIDWTANGANDDSVVISRFHKGHLLYEIYRMCEAIGWQWHSKYFLSLTLIEDLLTHFFLRNKKPAIFDDAQNAGYAPLSAKKLDPVPRNRGTRRKTSSTSQKEGSQRDEVFENFWIYTGSCEALRVKHGLDSGRVKAVIAKMAHDVFGYRNTAPSETVDDSVIPQLGSAATRGKRKWPAAWVLFPEWVIGRCDMDQVVQSSPSTEESLRYPFNRVYWAWMSSCLLAPEYNNPQRGKTGLVDASMLFEETARYLLSAVPGVRVKMNVSGKGGELDLIGFIDAQSRHIYDVFGSEFIGECKWTAEATSVAQVSLQSLRTQRLHCKSFVYFTRNGVSGTNSNRYGDLELLLAATQHAITGIPIDCKMLGIERANEKFGHLTARARGKKRLGMNDVLTLPQLDFPALWKKSYETSRFGLYLS